VLFEFVRASDRAPMSGELRFHGESYGWEAQILERGELFSTRGRFATNTTLLLSLVQIGRIPYAVMRDRCSGACAAEAAR
jgi:hypothetical protein